MQGGSQLLYWCKLQVIEGGDYAKRTEEELTSSDRCKHFERRCRSPSEHQCFWMYRNAHDVEVESDYSRQVQVRQTS